VTISEHQNTSNFQEPRFVWLRHQFYHRVVGKILPVSWFAPTAPQANELTVFPQAGEMLKLQIVSHCWNYSHLLRFQLSSLYKYSINNCELTYTLFYCEEDTNTVALIEEFEQYDIPNLTWDFRTLPREQLFRRAIGRNQASLATQANWVFFVDCDLILHEGCLDSVTAALSGQQLGLAFPSYEGLTELLPAEHTLLNQTPKADGTLDIDPTLFKQAPIMKPKGGYQFVHGDVARAAGYCGSISLYQQPTKVWRKTFEDTTFRTVIQDQGTPVEVKGIFRIRHQEKGRYQKETIWGRLRKSIRTITD